MKTFKEFVDNKNKLYTEAPALPAGVQAVTNPAKTPQPTTTQQNTVNAKKDNAAQKQTAQGFQDLATMFKQFSDKMRYIAGGLGRA